MNIEVVSSRKNSVIIDTKELIDSSNKRLERGLFVAEGARLACDAALSMTRILRLLYTDKAYEKYKKYIDEIANVAEECYVIKEHVAKGLADTKNSQNVFVVCQIPKSNAEIKGKILVLENLRDPANVGTIMRTAEALGIKNIALVGDFCDPYSPKVTRSSMGAVFRANISTYKNSKEIINEIKDNGYTSYAAVVDTGAKIVTDIDFPLKTAVFIGNEGDGLLKETAMLCDERVTIPMKGRAESLNASAAASILMWEIVRNS